MTSILLLAATLAISLGGATNDSQIVCRVQDKGNGPKIYVDGKSEPHHWVWVRDTIRNQALTPNWRAFDIPVTPAIDCKGCALWIRIEHKLGLFEARNMRIVASDGTNYPLSGWWVRLPQHRPYVHWSDDGKNGVCSLRFDFTKAGTPSNLFEKSSFDVYSNRRDFRRGVTYRVQFEARAEGIGYFRPGIDVFSQDDNYHGWLEELPTDNWRELSSGVQVNMAGRNGADFVTYAAPSCWFDGVDDFSPAIAQARRIIEANPKALLVPRIQLDVPPWWVKKHPNDKVVLHDGTAINARHGNISSEAYRADAFRYLAKYIRALQEAFPRNFAGVHPGMQNTSECFYPESWGKMCGYDPHTLREWRSWLKARGAADWANAEVPRPEDRRRAHGERRFFDEADPVEARCVEFARFQQAEMVRFIRDTCRVCREATQGKKLVLIFYGYTWEFAGVHQGPGATGHYGVGQLLETIGGDMDIVSAPLSYAKDRRYLGSTPIMLAAETFMRHGILPVFEDDSRTHLDQRLAAAVQEGVTMNERETIEMLTRNKGVMAVRGFESWWMDLMGQGWFADEKIWNICPQLQAADLANCQRSRAYTPPVAIIHDEDSMLHVDFGGKNFTSPLSHSSRTAFARTGAGFGQYLLSDAAKNPLAAKLQIHLSSWALDKETADRLVADRVARPDVTRVWCWLPGCMTAHGLDLSAGERLTGFRLKRATVKVPVARATPEGRAVGLRDVIAATKEEFFYEAGTRCDALLTVETNKGDVVWATWSDGSPAIVARPNKGGTGLGVYYGVNCFDAASASALVRASGVFSHFAVCDGKASLSASDDLIVLQQHVDGPREIVFPERVRVCDVRENRDLGETQRLTFNLRQGDVKILRMRRAHKDEPQRVLELTPGPGNSRNSEGSFIKLRDGRILMIYTRYLGMGGGDSDPAVLAQCESCDGGLTWSTNSVDVVKNEGGGNNVMSVSLLRLKNGEIALFYLRKLRGGACFPVVRFSQDEAKTWSAPIVCIDNPLKAGFCVLNNDRAIQLACGRILLPIARHCLTAKGADMMGQIFCLHSDDNGRTWKKTEPEFKAFEPDGTRIKLQEPGVVALKDGRIMMWIRTDGGRELACYSSDRGETWTKPEKTDIHCPCAPVSIKRLKNGDLLMAWNDHRGHPELKPLNAYHAGTRSPFTLAISKDDGKTWIRRKVLEGNVYHGGWYCYTAMMEDGDAVLLEYCCMKHLCHSRIARVPLKWIYGPDPEGGPTTLKGYFND